MATIRLTMAQALVKYLCAQHTVLDGAEAPLFGGVFARELSDVTTDGYFL